jgi:hypothetical protein
LVPVLLLCGPGRAEASSIAIDTLLSNPSFEGGVNATTLCPNSWTCSNTSGGNTGFGAFQPSSTDYTAGADGLLNPALVPDGSFATFTPSGATTSDFMSQSVTSKWSSSNTYTFTFWVGLPKDAAYPADTNGNGAVVVYFTGNGSLFGRVDIASPGVGQWKQEVLTVQSGDVSGHAGQTIGVEFWVADRSSNGDEVNFDIPASGVGTQSTAVPEPASLALLGTGLCALFRRRVLPRRS